MRELINIQSGTVTTLTVSRIKWYAWKLSITRMYMEETPGEITFYIPKTVRRVRVEALLMLLPAGIEVSVVDMKNPLKLKKYHYMRLT